MARCRNTDVEWHINRGDLDVLLLEFAYAFHFI